MKKIITICAVLLMTASVFAQAPEKMSYQAVVRDGSNALVTSTAVGMQISILQGSASGTAVYVETQTPTSNANGLVSLEIGSGTVVSGDFTTIDWANGPYFIKTETDPTGGTSYTITGTSQLLSVPYALHAKTAETVTGTITETDPIFGASVASGITGADTTNWNNKLDSYTETDPIFSAWDKSTGISITESQISDLQNYLTSEVDGSVTNEIQALSISNDTIYLSDGGFVKLPAGFDGQYSSLTGTPTNVSSFTNDAGYLTSFTEADGSETKVTAGTNVTITGTGTTASPYVVNATSGGSTLAIGDSYQGGIIFWLDATGQHGLIAATADQSTEIQWYNGTYRYTGTAGDGLYAGAMNTAMIVATQMADNQSGSFAAKVCADYSVTVDGVTYGDWYLPSKYELNLLYLQKNAVGGFASAYYWSSTEASSWYAWDQNFGNGIQSDGNKNFLFNRVRAIRAF